MKKTLSFILALLLTTLLLAGPVLAASDNGRGQGKNHKENKSWQQVNQQQNDQLQNQDKNQEKKQTSTRYQLRKSLQEKYRVYSQEKSSQDACRFSDVNQHWAAPAIREAAALGLFAGYKDGSFKPDQPLTQVEALVLVINISEDDDDVTTANDDASLADIPVWARDKAGIAAREGIIKLSRFHSAMQASRAQVAVMIAKALKLEPVDTADIPFKDGLQISREDLGYILALYKEGIMVGSSNGNFNPNSAITRAEMASILKELLDKSEITSITLPASASLIQGESLTLEATVKYADGTSDHQVSWSSSNTDLATVEDGVVTAAADAAGRVDITATASRGDSSKSATCRVTITSDTPAEAGTLQATGNTGGHDGAVYEEYLLQVDGQTINMDQDHVKSITLQKDGGGIIELSADTDSNLWFNVQRESGSYSLRVVDNSNNIYQAELEWTAPRQETATATGNERERDGIGYAEYKIGSLDLSGASFMYQIKPDGEVEILAAGSDANLWCRITNQISGRHIFLIKQNQVWYTTSINF